MSEKRESAKRLKAAAILEGALDVFLEEGYRGTSMDAVVERTGVSKPTIYKHFQSKERLFEAIVRQVADQILVPIEETTDSRVSAREALLRFAKRYAAVILSPRALALHRLVVGEAERFPELGSLYFETGYLRATHGVERFLGEIAGRDGHLEFDDPELAAHDFWALVLGHAHNRRLLNADAALRGQKLDAMLKRGIDTFLAAYAARAPVRSSNRRHPRSRTGQVVRPGAS